MKRPNFLSAFYLMALVLLAFACKKDEASAGHKIVFEITGNFSGSILAVVSGGNGSFNTREITKLPWKEEITPDANTKVINATANGNGGMAGQQASFKIYDNGKEVANGSSTTLSSGFIALNPGSYTIK
jgi:hypothetical protein